jgi:hypothetical protein
MEPMETNEVAYSIIEAAGETDGESLAELYNKIFDREIVYAGNNLFQFKDELSKEDMELIETGMYSSVYHKK